MSRIESRILSLTGNIDRQDTWTRPIPTVFIGLGGSGKDVVMRLRKRFADRFNTKDPGYAGFVFIDTDVQKFVPTGEEADAYAELAPHSSELVKCPITPEQFQRTFGDLRARRDASHLAWLKPDMERYGPGAVAEGAGTHREFGRLAFFLNQKDIRHTIETQIEAVLRYAAQNTNRVTEGRLEVVVVTSLAGGTGAGMFIDVAYLVQDVLGQPNYHALDGKSVSLICFLPGVLESVKNADSLRPRFRQNAFAALMELEYYGTPRTGDELFLGTLRDGYRRERNWTGFRADWGEGRPRFIKGAGWDNCYLIDNRNNLDPSNPLSVAEVFQMAADYLFLDFENFEFSTAKRSARSNLVQYKDNVKETGVRRADTADASGTVFDGNLLYATQNGCRFSSFGLSEIHFDVEKLYRAASYRLASLMIRRRWLGGPDRYPQAQYVSWVKEDLWQPRAEGSSKPPPSFLPEGLGRHLLAGTGGGSRLDELKRDLAELDEVGSEEAAARMQRVLNKHAGLLQAGGRPAGGAGRTEPGPARKAIDENAEKLGGDANTLGPLRTRLAELAARHASRHGLTATFRLLNDYREAFRQARDRARGQAEAAVPGDVELLARLREAARVPWPVRDTALEIERDRVRGDVVKALELRYGKATAAATDGLLEDLGQYIGSADEVRPENLVRHGTLYARYAEARTFLTDLAERLEERFRVVPLGEIVRADTSAKLAPGARTEKVVRRLSLSPNWDVPGYDRRINEALVSHPEVREADEPFEVFMFDWPRFETLVIGRLRTAHPSVLGEARNVDDLVRAWIRNRLNSKDRINDVAEHLAAACNAVLRGAIGPDGQHAGGFHLADEEYGNAVDYIRQHREDWEQLLEKLVKASMPYLQTTDPNRISPGFSPAFNSLYGQKPGTHNPAVSARNAAEVHGRVKGLVADRARGFNGQTARTISPPLAADNSAIILVREMVGFPLQYYAHLEDLREAYVSTPTGTGQNNECHIDHREAVEDLPDITLLEDETYVLIRENVSHAILGMVLGLINWREGLLKVTVPDPYGGQGIEVRLGSRLHRAVKYACEQDRIRTYLTRGWLAFMDRAGPREWACLYAAERMTWVQLRPPQDARVNDVSSPLYNCYEGLLRQSMEKLENEPTGMGKRWLGVLKPYAFPEATADGQRPGPVPPDEPLAARLVRTCIRRMSPDFPIFQIMTEHLADLPDPE